METRYVGHGTLATESQRRQTKSDQRPAKPVARDAGGPTSQYPPCDPVLHQTRVEVQEQPDTFFRQAHVSQELGLENRIEPLDLLDFHDHEIFND